MLRRRYATLDSRRVKFEKWHALGNDYLIVERAELPFMLTPARVRAICAPHTGVFADGILLLSPARRGEPVVARLQIFNPDGSEAELSGNGAREAMLYLRARGWTEADQFSIATQAGQIRAKISSATTCTTDLGVVRSVSDDYPDGAADGHGELRTDARSWSFQHVQVGNPQCAIVIENPAALDRLPLPEIGPAIEHHASFPNRTNVSWYAELEPGRIRARIFERGVGETSASGTGATGAAVAYVLSGGRSPVTVELDGGELVVEVGGDLHVNLTGWAVPVFAGTLAERFVEELHATE